MNLALVLGQNSENIKPKLVSIKDNLNIECFVDLQHFIKSAIKRDLIIDRIIIISTLVQGEDAINDIYNYWDNYNRGSEIVFLCRKGVDDELAKLFLSKFCSTNITTMSVASTTLHTLVEAVTLPISNISKNYSISDYLSVEVEDDSYKEPEKEPEQPISNTNNSGKGKRTLLGALFGKKSKQDTQENSENPNTSMGTDDISVPDEDSFESDEYEDSFTQQEEFTEEEFNNFDYDNEEVEDEFSNYEDNSVKTEDSYENYEENDDSLSSQYQSEENDDFNDFDFDEDTSQSEDFDSSQDVNEEVVDTNIEEEVVDEDFGDLTYTDNVSNVSEVKQTVQQEEVNDLDIDLSLGSAEEEYRKKTEQPKVIKETVVKEVVKSVKSSTVLQNIYKGVAHKLIIVTGDRGSGVTTTAWNIASHFSKKVPVLYFDCDIENHGLMNYIDYFDFKNFEQSHLQGVKLCRNSRAFDSCVCRWDTNVDLLTTDFGVEVTDDELILAQGVVAENMNRYGVVIVDCPISKLHCMQDLILTGNVAICVEDSRRGIMNILNQLDLSELQLRYKRNIAGKGTMVRTKVTSKSDYKRLIKYVDSIVDLEDCNWLSMPAIEFKGKVTSDFLAEILEG